MAAPETRRAPTLTVGMFSHAGGLSGGAERSLLLTVEVLQRRGATAVVFVPGPGALRDALAERGVACHEVPYRAWMGLNRKALPRTYRSLVNALQLPALVRLARDHRLDVVYTNTVTIPVGAVLARALGLAHVWHLREFGFEDHGLRFDFGAAVAYELMRASGSVFLANSGAVARSHGEHLRCPIEVVDQYLPEAGAEAPPLPADAFGSRWPLELVIVGTVTPGKRQEDAIAALGHLRARGLRARLHVIGGAGDPAYAERMRQRVEALGLGDRVLFHGFQPHARSFVQSLADVALVCSAREAFGRVTVEAMMAGKPVVASRSGGTPEIVTDGVDGVLYEPEDPVALADALAELHADPEARRRLGARARETVLARFGSADRYGRQIEQALRRAMEGRQGAPARRDWGRAAP